MQTSQAMVMVVQDASRATLFVFSGRPGTGKTTLARALARKRRATYLRIDAIEYALRTAAAAPAAGYDVAFALAASNLALGNEVVVDAVNALASTRQAWRNAAAEHAARMVEFEITCSDVASHRTRLRSRVSDYPAEPITWEQVVDQPYDAWDRSHIVLDTAGKSVEESIADVLTEIDADMNAR